MKKVIISACLLGEYCRYDGKTKKIDAILNSFKDYEIIPFCPEAPIFGTPRERISLVKNDNSVRVITDETNKDVTELLSSEIRSFLSNHADVDAIVLKSKSPSCGVGTTPVLNEKKELLEYGSGLAAEMFQKHFADVKIFDEEEFLNKF